ncbi:MAG: spiro-SPASM protein [Treponemataceae bacterium]|nr:spiro-SPASM protein [Treponemataceae bacterium]
MKTFVAVYISHFDNNYFNNVVSWAYRIPDVAKISFYAEESCSNEASAFLKDKFASEKLISSAPIVAKQGWTLPELLAAISADNTGCAASPKNAATQENGANNGCDACETVVFAWADCPFYNDELTSKLYKQHVEYAAEYSYADGWPYGLVPEFLASGTVKILAKLAEQKLAEQKQAEKSRSENQANQRSEQKDAQKSEKSCGKLTKDSLFNLIKTDINSFEIETLISPVDFRMYKLEFTCSTKRGALLCKRLSELRQKSGMNALKFCNEAVKSSAVLHTLPYFYSIQIAEKCTGNCIYCPYPQAYRQKYGKLPSEADGTAFMSYERFCKLIDGIKGFSDDAVVAFSLWGEPMYHPEIIKFVAKVLEYTSLSVLIETTGVNIDEDFCEQMKKVVEAAPARTGNYPPVMWIVSLDAVTQKTYEILHPCSEFTLQQASDAAALLRKAFPDSTYVQMVRTEHNEEELEPFFRGHDNRIIQKYDYFCGKLPQFKPADLSPIKRNECWHLRRDLQILSDGSVPLCKEYMFYSCVGNVFYESFEDVWNKGVPLLESQINQEYPDLCRNCDEFYTCNF